MQDDCNPGLWPTVAGQKGLTTRKQSQASNKVRAKSKRGRVPDNDKSSANLQLFMVVRVSRKGLVALEVVLNREVAPVRAKLKRCVAFCSSKGGGTTRQGASL